jgi:hypothetical protein
MVRVTRHEVRNRARIRTKPRSSALALTPAAANIPQILREHSGAALDVRGDTLYTTSLCPPVDKLKFRAPEAPGALFGVVGLLMYGTLPGASGRRTGSAAGRMRQIRRSGILQRTKI